MSDTIPTNRGEMTPQGVLDTLLYANYRYNRESCGMSAESGRKWYPGGEDLEAQYQADLAIEKASAA